MISQDPVKNNLGALDICAKADGKNQQYRHNRLNKDP